MRGNNICSGTGKWLGTCLDHTYFASMMLRQEFLDEEMNDK